MSTRNSVIFCIAMLLMAVCKLDFAGDCNVDYQETSYQCWPALDPTNFPNESCKEGRCGSYGGCTTGPTQEITYHNPQILESFEPEEPLGPPRGPDATVNCDTVRECVFGTPVKQSICKRSCTCSDVWSGYSTLITCRSIETGVIVYHPTTRTSVTFDSSQECD